MFVDTTLNEYGVKVMDAPVTDEELLAVDLYADDKDDAGASMCQSRIVTTRKPHTCRWELGKNGHDIPVGTRARVEKALIDNEWTSFYICAEHLSSWVIEEERCPAPRGRV